jgi:hypothetical protein
MSIVGADPTRTFSTLTDGRSFGLGDRYTDNLGNEYVFVLAGGAITQYDTVHVNSAYSANAITAALAITPGFVGFAQVAFASADYGWVMTRGKPTVRVAASCAKDVALYTTDTAGVLDDATASASHHQIMGTLITTTQSTASTVVAVASFPMVRRPAP